MFDRRDHEASARLLHIRCTVHPVAHDEEGGVERVLLEDLEDLSPRRMIVAESLVPLLFHLLDGTRDRAAVAADWARITGQPIPDSALDRLLSHLDDALLLEGEAVERARRESLAAYRSRPFRPMAHGGIAYPAEAEALQDRLDALRRASGVGAIRAPVHGVLAPHIDPRGGGACHGAAAEALAASPASVFVVLGTAHEPLRRPFALTTHDFATPTGRLATDRDLVERLGRRGGGDLLADERRHGGEHSVEFQAVWIHALHGRRSDVRIVPVLVGSLHRRILGGGSPREDRDVRDFVEALRELRQDLGDRVAFVASVDFAHVGPNYGGAASPDEVELAQVMEQDRALLGEAERVDAEGWFRFLQGERDARSVCGAAPTYVFLGAIADWGLTGRTLRHDLWEIDPDTGSHVSFAAVAYTREPSRSAP